MAKIPIAIYGAGGFAREVAWLIEVINQTDEQYQLVGFVDDDPKLRGQSINDVVVFALEDLKSQYPDSRIVSGIGNPQIRQTLMEKSAQAGFTFETLIHPRAERSRWIEYGEGIVICAGTILTTNIKLGNHVQINLDCTIGHDVVMGDYTTLAPGVHVSGWVHFGKRVYVGTGAVIINGTREKPLIIGDDAVIGAGACVTKSIEPGLIVVGVPARPLQRN